MTSYNGQMYDEVASGDISYLYLRDVPDLLQKYPPPGGRALDYGCGSGIRVPFLQGLGYEVEGVDIESAMLELARENSPLVPFRLIKSAEVMCEDGCFDLVFNCYVLMDVPDKKEIQKIMNESYRILKPGGILLVLVTSEALHQPGYRSTFYHLPEGQLATSGRKMKLFVKDTDLSFEDYFWTDTDYRKMFNRAGFKLLKHHLPLGNEHEGFRWQDELNLSPTSTYVLKRPE
ncbi:class I SAM-dependent methyltransferase [Endozoicomonas arenosclerae]|uniref:class I SAM-dependent methyltransferase n=1 Tax=Endozoicomonas arenosclerae TaxID=1633495 RepID=UPI00078555D1|nr:class I SAM-dependent methyltransferase [Endozoicomonas arenosclerae]